METNILRDHLTASPDLTSPRSTPLPANDPSKSVVQCPHCDHKLLNENSLKVHLIYHHGIGQDNNMWMNTQDSTEPTQAAPMSDQPSSSNDHALNDDNIHNQPQIPVENLEFSSVLTNVDGMHMSSNSQQKYAPPSAMSPMQFDFSSPSANNVSSSFQPSSSQYLNDYSHIPNSNEYGITQSYSTIAGFNRANGYSPDEVDYQNSYDRQFAPGGPRFHPYVRSPLPSPLVIKEEPIIKTETQEILDLDSHRFLQNSSHTTAVPQLSGGTVSHIWRPADHQLSNSPTLPPMPLTGGHMQSLSSGSMYGGSVMHSQHSPSHGPMGYPSPIPSNNYHPQGFSQVNSLPPLGLPKLSPNYLQSDSSQNSSIIQSQPPPQTRQANDGPPTEFPTNVKRPKNFKCEICLKWFTSQGHLKRHYNTTLHKNMAKQKENTAETELTDPLAMQSTSMQSSILQPVNSPAMPSMSPAMPPTMSPAMPPVMTPTMSPAMPPGGLPAMSPAMTPSMSPVITSSLPPSDSPMMSSSPRLPSNGMTVQPGPDSSNRLVSEPEEKSADLNPSPLAYQMSNEIQYSQAPEQNIQYHSTYGGNDSFEPNYNDYSSRSLEPYSVASSTNSSNVPTSSTMYHGHFSSSNSQNGLGISSQFFLTGPTPMTGGGTTFLRPNDSTIRPTPSPHPSSQAHLGGYNMSPVATMSSNFSGVSSSSTNEYLSQSNPDIMGQNRPVNRYSPQENASGEVDSIIDGFTTFPSLNSMEAKDQATRQEINNHYFAEPDGRPPSISPEVRSGSALDSTSDGSRDSISTTASGGSTSSNTPTTKTKEGKDAPVKCPDCSKVCASPCYLTQHRKRYHSGVLDYKCEKCGKKFSERTNYEEHKLKHAGDKPYKCEECPKQFNHKTDLRRHSCLHTGEKPFHCPTCNKGFIRKDHMMKHQMTHEKKRQAAAAAAAVNSIPTSHHIPVSMNGALPGYPPAHMPTNALMPDRFIPNSYPSMGHHHHLAPPPHHNPPTLAQHPSSLPRVY